MAQQEAEKARFLVEKAEFVKTAAVIQVTGLLIPNTGSNWRWKPPSTLFKVVSTFFVILSPLHPVVQAEGDTEAADLLAKAFAASGEGLVELRLVD